MKLLTFLGLCLVLHLSLAEFGSRKIPPFRPEKDEKADEVFGIRDKRGVFDKIPPIVPEEDDKINGLVAGHHSNLNKREQESDGINLPLLMKTHRLRPGSGDDIKRIIDDYINSHKGDGEVVEDGEKVDEPRLLGEPLIGKNRHPKGGDHNIHKREADEENAGEEIKLPGKNLIPKNRHPKGDKKDDGHGIQKRDVENNKGNDDLPLLLKSHRLRPGSGDGINDIIEKYIQSHKGEQQQEGEGGDGQQPELPGRHLIPKERHPKPDGDDKEQKGDDGQKLPPPPPPQNGIDLPLLMKTHRLRPGSGDDIQRTIDDYIKAHKGGDDGDENVGEIKLPGRHLIPKERHPKPDEDKKEVPAQSSIEQDEDVDDDSDIRPLGMGLIGKFRRPPVNPDGKNRIVRGNNGKPGQVECKEEDRQQVLRCFRGYFKNYDLELVDGKLPTMREIFHKFKDVKDYEKHQKYFKEFSGCFKSTPETCFHADELCKISQQGEEADYLATFFTISEFSFKSKHNKKIAKCFIKQVEKCAQHKGQEFKECDSAKQIFNEAIDKFNVNCAKFKPEPSDLKTLLSPFIDRTTLGENCPNLISEINV